MAQKCMSCQKPLEDGTMVMIRCPAYFEQFSDGIHRISPDDVEAIWCMDCEYAEDEEDD